MFHHQVLQLEVPVADSHAVAVLHRRDDLRAQSHLENRARPVRRRRKTAGGGSGRGGSSERGCCLWRRVPAGRPTVHGLKKPDTRSSALVCHGRRASSVLPAIPMACCSRLLLAAWPHALAAQPLRFESRPMNLSVLSDAAAAERVFIFSWVGGRGAAPSGIGPALTAS